MREILFRGKRVDNGEWVEGDLLHGHPHHAKNGNLTIVQGGCVYIEVISETVGQFTGLTDKEGNRIFEGDIIEFTYWWFDGAEQDTCLRGVIVYSSENMSYQLKGVKNKEWEKHTGYENDTEYLTPFSELNFAEADFKVIGNIHDNPNF